MKKLLLSAITFLSVISMFGQADKIYKHNGEVIEVKVLKISEEAIMYAYIDEDVENELGKYAVEKIVFGKSGRVENITEKIVINSKEDWENVILIEDIKQTSGLKRVAEIRGKTSFINFHTANTGDKKALKLLKQEAAGNGAAFILMQAEKSSVGRSSNQLGGSQEVKRGVCYKY